MGLWIAGEFTPEERKFIENETDNEVWTWVASRDELDEGDDRPGAYYEKGSQVLGYAALLLKILDNGKSKRILDIEEAASKQKFDEQTQLFYLSLNEVREIYQLIKDLPERMTEIIDDWNEIRPEKRELVKRVAPGLFRYGDDTHAWSLFTQPQMEQLVKFLELAIKKNREIGVG